MGLSAREKEGCRSTLDNLDTSDLLSLYRTVAKSTTTVRNRVALIEEIMEHSQSAVELLNRKRVYKEIILNYLNNENLFMPMNSTKFEIIQKAIEHWKEPPDASDKSSANIPSRGSSSPKESPQKSQKACKPEEATKPSSSTNTSQPDTSANTPSKGTSLTKKAPQKSKKACPLEEISKQLASATIDQLDTSSNSSSTVDKGISFPKKPLQQTQKAHQTEGSSKTPKSTPSDAGATVSVSVSPCCPQRTVHNPKQKTTSQEPPVTSVTVTVSTSGVRGQQATEGGVHVRVTMMDEVTRTPVPQQDTNEFSQDSSAQGTMMKP